MVKFSFQLLCFMMLLGPYHVWAQIALEKPVNASGEETAIAGEDLSFEVTVNVVDIVLNDEHRNGVEWPAIVSDFHNVMLKKVDNPIWADKKYRLSVGTVSDEDYQVLLEALDTVGRVSSHQQLPVTVAMDSSQTIDVPDDKVMLHVSLSKAKDGQLRMGLEPHLTLGKLELKAQTDTVLNPGRTIVIGSIFEEQEITKTHKFPLLGDLPIVGLVFRSHGRLMQKSEKIIFVTVGQSR